MPYFDVFSKVEINGYHSEDELWKFRGNFLADDSRKAIEQVAEVDALNNSSGDIKEYASTRSSCFDRRVIKFRVMADLDNA